MRIRRRKRVGETDLADESGVFQSGVCDLIDFAIHSTLYIEKIGFDAIAYMERK